MKRVKIDREQYVVKANDLIRKTRYDLPAQQQKIVLYAISKIKPNDGPDKWYEFEISDFCDACGIDMDAGGTYYGRIKNDLTNLTGRKWCKLPDGSERTMSWIGDAIMMPLSSTVSIRFNPNMHEFLFDLKERYTQYKLVNVLAFRGKYAIRFYELMKSYMIPALMDSFKPQIITIEYEKIREILDITVYDRWVDFDRNVIKKAIDEINELSDEMHITYTTQRKGRMIHAVNFTISMPRAKQMISANEKRTKRLDKRKLTQTERNDISDKIEDQILRK